MYVTGGEFIVFQGEFLLFDIEVPRRRIQARPTVPLPTIDSIDLRVVFAAQDPSSDGFRTEWEMMTVSQLGEA